jgi:hypothetical protein
VECAHDWHDPKPSNRTELIEWLRDSYIPGVNEDLREAADMLEADAVQIARLKDVPMKYKRLAFNAELQHEVDKLQAAARLALDALINLQPIIGNGLLTKQQLAFIDPSLDVAITALREAL